MPEGQQFYAALGSPGGSSIPGATLNVLLGMVDFGLSPGDATDLPRVLAKNGPVLMEGALQFGAPEVPVVPVGGDSSSSGARRYRVVDGLDVVRSLEARGFALEAAAATTATFGTVQTAVVGADGVLYGAADSSRHAEATAAGL